jgi:hypothetical protein
MIVMKKFFSISPFQSVKSENGGLQPYLYKAMNNNLLQYDKNISFPILAVINAYTNKNEDIEVYTVVPEYSNSKQHYEEFKNQLGELEKEKGFKSVLKEIRVNYDDSLDTLLDLFQKFLNCVCENDKLYMCITYGSKPMPIVQIMAINYAYRIFQNVRIGAIVYGKIDHETKKPFLYDVTSLFYMDEIVRTLAENKAKSPKEIIKKLINFEEA